MLRDMTWPQFREWQIFDELEPFGEEREDWRSASVVQALYNIFTRNAETSPRPLREFLLLFGDAKRPEGIKQQLDYQELLIETWISTNNAIHSAKEAVH